MELTITFFIKFTLVVHFILALFSLVLSLFRFNDEFNRYEISKFSSLPKTLHFNLLSFKFSFRRVIYEKANLPLI